MNICEDRHEPKYQITYRSAKPKFYTPLESVTLRRYNPVWLVCEACMENKECFGTHDDIEIMEMLT